MPTPKLKPGHPSWEQAEAAWMRHQQGERISDIAEDIERNWTVVEHWIQKVEQHVSGAGALSGYDLETPEKTPQQAWNEAHKTTERTISATLSKQWKTIDRPPGPFVLFHSTDEHLDDDATPLKLVEADIRASHEMGAIMCHGGDALNSWPLQGRLAKKWAEQQCTLPDSLLRWQYFVEIFKPDVVTHGNHQEMITMIADLMNVYLPENTIQDYWTVNFKVQPQGGREFKVSLSHKFQKGSSWFHPHHGFIREILEGEEADIYLEGHLHVSGWMYRTLPQRGVSALGVSSAGYKVVDKYAARISRGGKIPKLKGRAHWIVCDDQADKDQQAAMPFDCPIQAEAYLSGLQNLRAA